MRVRTHPGKILQRQFMEPFELSATALAKLLHVPQNRVSDIVRGRRDITADTAIRLSKVFGNTAQFWINLQTNHDLSKAEVEGDYSMLKEIA